MVEEQVEPWSIPLDATTSIGNNRKKKQVNSKAQMFKNCSVLTACFIATNAWSVRGTSSEATAVRLSTSAGCAHCLSTKLESFQHCQQHYCGYQCITIVIAAVAVFINVTDALAPRICRSVLATPTHTDNDTRQQTLCWMQFRGQQSSHHQTWS